MKKSKFFAAALAATMFATAACGLVACDKDPGELVPTNNPNFSQGTEYTVTFSGANVTKTTSGGKLSGTMPTATAPSGQEFKGWAKSSTATTPDITASNYASYKFSGTETAITLYPVFATQQQQGNNPVEYTITLDATTNGGSCSTASVTTVNKVIPSLPAATKGTDTFNGWFTAPTGGTKVNSGDTADGTVTTIYAQFTESGNIVPDYSTDGVYIGNTLAAALVPNLGQELYKNEWWFGDSVMNTFTAGATAQVYINGQLVNAFISSSSVGISVPSTDTEYNEFSITTTGQFAVYVRENEDGTWGVQFAGPTEVGEDDTLPQGTAIMLNCAGNTKIRLFLEFNGTAVTNVGSYKIWAWNGGENLTGGVWPGKTLGANVTLTGSMSSLTNFIISGDFGQTADLNGMEATAAGNTYLLKINKSGDSVTTELVKINVPI